MSKKHKILICAGGTGGHIFPAMNLAHFLLQENDQVVFSGTGLTTNPYFEKEKFIFFDIPSSPVKMFHFFSMLLKWIKGIVKSFILIKRIKPDLVVGFGSFHTFPLLFCARICNVDYILFEANVSLGKVNRLFAKKAKLQTGIFLNKKNTKMVPLDFFTCHTKKMTKSEAREKLHLKRDMFTLLIFGGSQGSFFINEKILQIVEKFPRNWQIIHITGSEEQREKVQKTYNEKGIFSYVCAFTKEMSYLYSACDFAITRAGAATLAELIYFSLPSIVIPYPFSSENHQKENALFFQNEVKGGICLCQKKITTDFLLQSIEEISQKSSLEKFKKNISFYKEKRKKNKEESLHKLIYKILQKKKFTYG